MFLDDLPNASRYDAVIVGAGPAGLSCAMALAAARRRVLVIESGGAAAVVGDHSVGYGHFAGGYWNQHWVRGLGGTSQAWTGWCTIPTPLDFDNPAVGVRWPIAYDSMAPYWRRAAPILDHRAAFVGYQAPFVPGFAYRPVPTMAPTRFAEKFGPVAPGIRRDRRAARSPGGRARGQRRPLGADGADAGARRRWSGRAGSR